MRSLGKQGFKLIMLMTIDRRGWLECDRTRPIGKKLCLNVIPATKIIHCEHFFDRQIFIPKLIPDLLVNRTKPRFSKLLLRSGRK
jgi:hypothetical protein